MPNIKISNLSVMASAAAGDLIPIVDVSDLTMSANGTTKRVTQAVLSSSILASAQPLDATLTALANLTIAANSLTLGAGADAFTQHTFIANTFPARASTGILESKPITDFGLSLIDDVASSNARTTLGLGTMATATAADYLPLAGGTMAGAITGTTGTVAFRNSTTAQKIEIYGTYTDASNYVRASLSSSATAVTLAAESAGTGAANMDLILSPKGTGKVTTPGAATIGGTLTASSGNVTLSNGTSNTIFYGTTGLAVPGANSAGEKIQLYGGLGTVSSNDYAIGVESGSVWFNSGLGYKWYSASALKMYMNGTDFGLGPRPGLTNTFNVSKNGTVGTTPGIDFSGTTTGDSSTVYTSGRIYTQFDGTSFPTARLTLATPTGDGTFTDVLSLKNGNVGIGTTSPNANALLDVTSTTKAFMPPRMTTTQKNAIASPTAGMVVYDSTLNKLCVRAASAWETVTSV